MVERILNWLNREWGGIHEAALLLGLSALGSQILALIRDRLLAATFGAGSQLDIYYAAFRVPDFLYVTIASFVSVTVIIPFLICHLTDGEFLTARRFLDSMLTIFFLVMIPVLIVVWLFAPNFAYYLAPGFSPSEQQELITLLRILLLSPLLLGLSNLLGAVTQATRRFLIYALSPLVYNLGIILGVLIFYPLWGLPGLVWGVVLGALFHLTIQLPTVYRAGLLPKPTWQINWQEFWRVARVSLPRTLTLGAHQLSLLVLIALASLMGTGAVAVFNLALNLQSVPLTIIGVSYSVAAFPLLVKLFSNGQKSDFIGQVVVAMRHILFWSLPIMMLFVVLRAQIVRVLLGAGHFDWQDTKLTAAALALFIFSLFGQNLILLFVRAYYAAGRTRRPLFINTISSLGIVLIAWLLLRLASASEAWRFFFERMLRVSGVGHAEVLILPLAFTLGVIFNLFLYWIFFQRDFGRFPGVVDRALGQSVIGSLVAGFVSYQVLQWLAPLLNLNTFFGIFTQGFVAGILGLAVLILLLKYFNNKELAEIEKSLKLKFWRSQPIAPELEGL